MSETSEKRPSFDHLVVIGSSAGGITALSTLVATLPRDFPAPIVIAQHLDPSRASHLSEILARRSPLPVRILTEHEALVPGVVFVVPSNRNVEITDHAVRLNTELVGRSKPSVDVLLSTAAALFSENLVAVILTGSGSDGAAGARAVKAAGGTVVIQDPETAEFPSMPRALAPTSVDVVSSLENMGAVLHTLVTGVKAPRESQDERALGAVLPPTWSKEATPPVPRARTDGHRTNGSSTLKTPCLEAVDPDLGLEEPPLGAFPDGLLDDIPLGVVVVDRRYDILTINHAARLFLGIYHEAIGEDLIHLAQSLPGLLLRAAVDAAFRDGSSTRLDQIVPVILATGEECSLEITCRLVQLDVPIWEAPTVMILLNDRTAPEWARASQEDEIARLAARMRDMAEANRALLAANAALTNAGTTLRRDTVEARADTADAQAQTEEVITLNEELQATNEEMETLNEELQATIEEVETANDELDSRRLSLMDLNTSMETERAYLELILGSIGDAVLVVDTAGAITRTNAAYDALFGPNPLALVHLDEQGKRIPPVGLPPHRAAAGETFNMRFRANTADGAQHWFEADGRPLTTPNGGQHGVVVIRDITLFTQHQRLQDEFLSLASHELRTPLTSVLGYLGMLDRALRDPNGDERLRGFAAKALHEAERLVLMVRDLTDVSRLQSGKLTLNRKPLDFAALVAQVVVLARDLPPGHDIHLAADPGPMATYGDAMRLEQVIFNILTNAMFHAPSDRPIEVRLGRLDGRAHLEIEDHGRGIAPDQLSRLFSRFYQIEDRERASRQGMGLGLFICKELVTAHDGRVEAASIEGEGTTFTVWLPLLEEGS